jgi:hypothetical protein
MALTSIFDSSVVFGDLPTAYAHHSTRHNLDIPALLHAWELKQPSADFEAAALLRCLRAAVRAAGDGVADASAEPVSRGWTASSWGEADELRLLRKDGSLLAALHREGDTGHSQSQISKPTLPDHTHAVF